MIMLRRFLCGLSFAGAALAAWAQAAAPATDPATEHDAATTAAAAATVTHQVPRAPDFLGSVIDEVLQVFDVRTRENTVTHFVIAGIFLIGALLLRRVVTSIIFGYLRKLAARTTTTLDDKLFPALDTALRSPAEELLQLSLQARARVAGYTYRQTSDGLLAALASLTA